jgi:TPR repeat protein
MQNMNIAPMNLRFALVGCVLVCAALALWPAAAQNQNISTLRKQAKEGNAESQYELAKDYYTGTGVPKDLKQGLEWLRKFAGQGHSGAEFALPVTEAKADKPKPFSLADVEKGLQGGITYKRLATLVDKLKVDFTLSAELRERLGKAGADDNLLATISASKL